MRVLVTGAAGFLGWHTRVRLHALTRHEVVAVDRPEWPHLDHHLAGADAVLHLAGVNRGPDADVETGNVSAAEDLAAAMQRTGARPRIVFANSIQCGNGTPYGTGKQTALGTLAAAAERAGRDLVDVRLPNLFGEHGRPDYNSFVATFAHAVVEGREPTVVDRPVELLHAQSAAQALIGALEGAPGRLDPHGVQTTVAAVYESLRRANATYQQGDLPPLETDVDVDLFNTLRAARFPGHYPMPLPARRDERGRLVEVVRSHGGTGQTFISSTEPGVTRGEHFHLRKVERFVVVSGTATIRLRKVLTDEVVSFDVSGQEPVVVDMPTMWAHNITNTGGGELLTVFWTNELFDPAAPDTYREPVAAEPRGASAQVSEEQ